MVSMTDTRPASPTDRAAMVSTLMGTVGGHEGLVLDVLLRFFDRVEVLLAVKDAGTGRYVYVNAGMASLFDRTPSQMVGMTDGDLLDPSQWSVWRVVEQAALAQLTPTLSEHRLDRGGVKREFNVTRIAVAPVKPGGPAYLFSAWVELTATHQREAQLRQALVQLEQQQVAAEQARREMHDQSVRDGVTGLYQRQHFEEQLRREIDLSSREHREFALVSIALDTLSAAVQSRGADARGRVLEALGRLLRCNTRAMDASCRLDEGRFAVLLSGVGLATAHARMEGLRRQCATQIVVLDGRDFGFTVSMGVASFPHTAHTEEALLQASESALGDAKLRGGNHVTLASIRFDLS